MPELIYTVGLPRSGKSTWVSKWAAEEPMRVIVCSDNIRRALTGQRYQPLAETMVFATKHVMIRSLLDRGFDVCVDGTHSTDISLTRLYEIDINARGILFRTSSEICKNRAIATSQYDLIPIIDRIESNLTKTGFWNYDIDAKYFSYIDDIKNNVKNKNLYGKQ